MVIDIMYLILHSGLAHECHRVCVCVCVGGGGGGGEITCIYIHMLHTHTLY